MDVEKKLLRPKDGGMIGGVCAGIARYFEVDATLVRVAWVILAFIGGAGVLAYLVSWGLIPEEDGV